MVLTRRSKRKNLLQNANKSCVAKGLDIFLDEPSCFRHKQLY